MPDVVVFDDEPEILDVVREFLESGGLSVRVELATPNQPPDVYWVALAEAHPKLVITDWAGIGEAVLEVVETLQPRPKVAVFASHLEAARQSPRARLVSAFLLKPPADWSAFVRQIVNLAAAPEGSP